METPMETPMETRMETGLQMEKTTGIRNEEHR